MAFSSLDDPLIGPLMTSPAMRAVFSAESRLAAFLEVEVAIARGQAALGLTPRPLADAIAALGPADFDMPELARATTLAGVPVIPFVKALGAKLAPELEPHLHKGATTQDVHDTADTLLFRRAYAALRPDLAATLAGLAHLARRHASTPMAGRTYGQQAAPITFGWRAGTWANGIVDALEALDQAFERAMILSYGGPVGTIATFEERGPEVRARIAAELCLAETEGAWHVTRARRVMLGAALATLCGALAKMAADVAEQVTTEAGELSEPYLPGRGGSSAMPHKRNPVSATVIMAAASGARAQASILFESLIATGERPVGVWHAEWAVLPQLFGFLSGALVEARRLAEGLDVVPERMRANLELTRGLISADAAAAVIARCLGRAEAHAALEAASARVRATGETLYEVLIRNPRIAGQVDSESLQLAFDWRPAIDTAALWAERAAERAAAAAARLV